MRRSASLSRQTERTPRAVSTKLQASTIKSPVGSAPANLDTVEQLSISSVSSSGKRSAPRTLSSKQPTQQRVRQTKLTLTTCNRLQRLGPEALVNDASYRPVTRVDCHARHVRHVRTRHHGIQIHRLQRQQRPCIARDRSASRLGRTRILPPRSMTRMVAAPPG